MNPLSPDSIVSVCCSCGRRAPHSESRIAAGLSDADRWLLPAPAHGPESHGYCPPCAAAALAEFLNAAPGTEAASVSTVVQP